MTQTGGSTVEEKRGDHVYFLTNIDNNGASASAGSKTSSASGDDGMNISPAPLVNTDRK